MTQDEKTPAPPLTYPDGLAGIVARMDARRAPLGFAKGEALPPLDVDFELLKNQRVAPLDPAAIPRVRNQSGHLRKTLELTPEFEGLPKLCLLNAQLIAHLRKASQPAHTMDLFARIWREEQAFVIPHLDPRWLVSSITTFGDHGLTEVQRRVGSSMTVLFSTMKLYESERLFSGFAPEQEFKLKRLVRRKLPMNMDRYALMSGGLDVNMLGRIWTDAQEDPVIAPLAHHLLDLLNRDPGTVFRRLATLRGRKARQKAQSPASGADAEPEPAKPATLPARAKSHVWATVSTVKSDSKTLAPWIAHHLRLGASRMHIYLDAPLSGGTADGLSDPRVTFTLCDDAYWRTVGKPRPEKHQQRQSLNATHCYRNAQCDWLAHIDCDEYIYSPDPFENTLAAATLASEALVLPPAEEIAQTGDVTEVLFRRSYFDAGCPKSVIDALYPTFGQYLRSGFISHTVGKSVARTGLSDVRFGVHLLKRNGVESKAVERVQSANILHRHAPDWESFKAHLEFRLAHGSYRNHDAARLGLGDIIDVLRDAHGEDGPRLLFDEVCMARPEVLQALEKHNMLIRLNTSTLQTVHSDV